MSKCTCRHAFNTHKYMYRLKNERKKNTQPLNAPNTHSGNVIWTQCVMYSQRKHSHTERQRDRQRLILYQLFIQTNCGHFLTLSLKPLSFNALRTLSLLFFLVTCDCFFVPLLASWYFGLPVLQTNTWFCFGAYLTLRFPRCSCLLTYCALPLLVLYVGLFLSMHNYASPSFSLEYFMPAWFLTLRVLHVRVLLLIFCGSFCFGQEL